MGITRALIAKTTNSTYGKDSSTYMYGKTAAFMTKTSVLQAELQHLWPTSRSFHYWQPAPRWASLWHLWQRLQCLFMAKTPALIATIPALMAILQRLWQDSSTYDKNSCSSGKTLAGRSLDSIIHAHYPWLLLLCLALLVYMVYPLDGSYGTPRSSWTGNSYRAEKATMILKWDTLNITQRKTKLNEQQQWLRKRNPRYASQATVIIVMQQSIPHKHQNWAVNRTRAKKTMLHVN